MKKRKMPIEKSYFNSDFLESSDARSIRILSEYFHPLQVFRQKNITDAIVFFGSARAKAPRDLRKILEENKDKNLSEKEKKRLRNMQKLCNYYVEAAQLSYRLTQWSKQLPKGSPRFLIASGGGPGIMEAANRGAFLAKGVSIGLNIALPYEQSPNEYITRSLCFDFNYFFMRKYWFTYLAKALIVFPGGFGTADEIFEVLTLKQTYKLTKPLPIVIYGKEYWNSLINLETFVEWGMIDESDLEFVFLCDSVDEAFEYLTSQLNKLYLHEDNTTGNFIP